MSYKTYTVNLNDAISLRSSTDGYQPKFIVSNNKRFIKTQCELAGTLRDDWRVEDIASRICKILRIDSVQQTPCNISIISPKGAINKRKGVISENFSLQGNQFVSFSRLRNLVNNNQPLNKLNTIQKIAYIADIMHSATKLNTNKILDYLFNMITVDILVLNQDRHFKNFGVFYNTATNQYSIAKLFDFGMGLFENDTAYDSMDTLEECMRYSYIAPFGEDPFDLIKILGSTPEYRRYISNLKLDQLNLNKKLFIHPASYAYFIKAKKELERLQLQ